MKKEDREVREELLEKVAVEELRDFVREQADKNALFRREMDSWLYRQYGMEKPTSDFLVARVRSLFGGEPAEGGGDPLFDEEVCDWLFVAQELGNVIEELREQINRGNVSVVAEPVLEFFRQVCVRWDERLYREADVVSVEGALESCVKLLSEWAQSPAVTDTDKRHMLDAYRAVNEDCPDGREWIRDFMDGTYVDLMVTVLPPEDAYKEIEERYNAEGRSRKIVAHKLKLCKQLGRMKEMETTVWENVKYLEYVEDELRRLCELGRLSDALMLAIESIRVNGEKERTLRDKLHVAELMKDKAVIIDTRYKLAVHGKEDLEEYRKLKAVVPTNEWIWCFERLTDKLNRTAKYEYLAAIYKEEKEHVRLFKLITRVSRHRLSLIMTYLPYLPKKYHSQLLKMCVDILKESLLFAAPRGDYVKFAERLHRFSQLPGATSLTNSLLSFVRVTYRRRAALIEEIAKFFPVESYLSR